MKQPRNFLLAISSCGLFLLGLSLLGCGGGAGDRPDLGQVEGTITLDTKPLVGAHVTFQPENGRPSTAITNEAGRYVLNYKGANDPGAAVGKHKVIISTHQAGDPDSDDPAKQKDQKETIPAEYNSATTLTAEVKAGENEPINFDLKSGGKIVQPEE
jgi:hypothetical protein